MAELRYGHDNKTVLELRSLFLGGKQDLALGERRRAAAAQRLLCRFSDEVDRVRESQRKLATQKKQVARLYADYLLTVQQSTDALAQRLQRAEILRGVLGGVFETKDSRRAFTPEQRRLLWNSDERHECHVCGKALSWTNFQVDHIKAHSRGGRTILGNAALICAPCNAAKGARRKRSKKA